MRWKSPILHYKQQYAEINNFKDTLKTIVDKGVIRVVGCLGQLPPKAADKLRSLMKDLIKKKAINWRENKSLSLLDTKRGAVEIID